jgi:hypothetical protein
MFRIAGSCRYGEQPGANASEKGMEHFLRFFGRLEPSFDKMRYPGEIELVLRKEI